MYYTYVLKSKTRKYIYIGITSDYSRRIDEHNGGRNKTTKPYRPFELIQLEIFKNRPDARKREKYLKSGYGREYIKNKYLPGWRNW